MRKNKNYLYFKIRFILVVLAYYWSCLWYLSSSIGKERENEVELFRGIKYRTETKYKINEHYRFITFQSWSNKINKAAEYLDGVQKAFYTIILPKYWESGFYI